MDGFQAFNQGFQSVGIGKNFLDGRGQTVGVGGVPVRGILSDDSMEGGEGAAFSGVQGIGQFAQPVAQTVQPLGGPVNLIFQGRDLLFQGGDFAVD